MSTPQRSTGRDTLNLQWTSSGRHPEAPVAVQWITLGLPSTHTWPTLDLLLQAVAHCSYRQLPTVNVSSTVDLQWTYSGPTVDDTPKLQRPCSASHFTYPRLTPGLPST
jgi:hypothetical protein